MIIGVDIDGVLTNLFKFVDKKRKEICKKDKIKIVRNKNALNLRELYGITEEESDKFWIENIFEYAEKVKFYKSASKYLKKLKEDGHIIYLITLREYLGLKDENGQRMKEIVKKTLTQNNITFDKLYALHPVGEKLTTIVSEKVDVMIDDGASNLISISDYIPTICYSTVYNTGLKLDNMTRCKNWREIYKTIKLLQEEQKNEEDDNKSSIIKSELKKPELANEENNANNENSENNENSKNNEESEE